MATTLMHDRRKVLGADITRIHEAGGELRCLAHAAGPGFARRSVILLHLLDERSGKSMNVPVRLEGIQRNGDHWVFRFAWKDEAPMWYVRARESEKD